MIPLTKKKKAQWGSHNEDNKEANFDWMNGAQPPIKFPSVAQNEVSLLLLNPDSTFLPPERGKVPGVYCGRPVSPTYRPGGLAGAGEEGEQ